MRLCLKNGHHLRIKSCFMTFVFQAARDGTISSETLGIVHIHEVFVDRYFAGCFGRDT